MNGASRTERIFLFVLLLIFTWFTWRGFVMFFSGDDMMNMYGAWNLNPWRLARAQLFVWLPVYRPMGAAVYRIFYSLFAFHPLPLYIFCWLLLLANAVFSYRFFKVFARSSAEALMALSLTLVHGTFQDLYLSAGTIYDRLCFLFTVVGVRIYAKSRSRFRLPIVCLLCIFAMDSKESGVALPVLLGLYDLIFVLPQNRAYLRKIVPFYSVLALICVLFVFGRVKRTSELTANTAYHPQASAGLWLTRMAEYFGMLTYEHVAFTAASAAFVLLLMAIIAVGLRNRAMIFGLLFFMITITPVALITSRPGYVLYVPDLGLGIYFAALIGAAMRSIRAPEYAAAAAVTIAIMWFHVHNWPPPFDPHASPEWRLSDQFRREYPAMPAGAKLLFVSDEFPKPAYDLLFNLRMLYHDKTLRADRLDAPGDQQPDPKHPVAYDHIFSAEMGRYVELDNRDPKESIRLHILRDYSVGRMMDMTRRDHSAYVVSGVMDGDGAEPTRWTAPHARFKFDLYPAPATFSSKFWVPDFIAKSQAQTMNVSVNGKPIGSVDLTHDGMKEISLPVSADLITANGFTIVGFDIDKPYKDQNGTEFGVVLLNAGFIYSTPAGRKSH